MSLGLAKRPEVFKRSRRTTSSCRPHNCNGDAIGLLERKLPKIIRTGIDIGDVVIARAATMY